MGEETWAPPSKISKKEEGVNQLCWFQQVMAQRELPGFVFQKTGPGQRVRIGREASVCPQKNILARTPKGR